MSSSIRAVSSPRMVHGNSPLLKAVNVTPSSREEDSFPSPGQFSDAEFEEGSTSPSSRALQDQLHSATKALEELKEAVRSRRTKRYSLSSRDLDSEAVSCIGTAQECLSSIDGAGLGITMGTRSDSFVPRDHQSKSADSPRAMPFTVPAPWQNAPGRNSVDLPTRRHWSKDTTNDCNKKSHSTAISEKQIFSPHIVASPTMTSTAPPTPSLEIGAFGATATPIMPSSTFSASNTTTTQQQGTQNGSSSAFASHRNSSNATAIAAVGAAGSLLILAALLIAIYFRKQRTRRHKSQMASVLDKVAPLPSPSDDTDKEKQKVGAIGSNDFFAAASQKGTATQNNSEEYRTVPPWLSLNMGSHPFASASMRGERYSHDLANSGVMGSQAPSKDHSFNWNFPKLSVPPAAARAISAGHYIKKRATTLPQGTLEQPERQAKSMSSPSFVSRRCSSGHEQADVMSQSASSECVDPEVDHRRKTFAVFDASTRSIGWIKSAFRHLTPTQQKNQQQNNKGDLEGIDNSSFSSPWIPSISSRRSISQSSEDRSITMIKARSTTSLAHFVPDSHALTQAVVQQVMEIRLPSLSIANSPMLDVKEVPRVSSLKWTTDKTTPQRSLSNGSEGRLDFIAPQINRGGSRRVSWAGPLESCREDSKESMLDYLRFSESASKVNNIRRSRAWTSNNDSTDTDDDTKEGYEAESEEMDTEGEMECNQLTSFTPVITLTCSEEEGRFERQISLNSVYREATSSDDHSKLELRKEKVLEIANNVVSDSSDHDDDDEDGATIILHSCASTDDYGDETDSCHSAALHSLLVDDFPTIPEWTPIPATARSTIL